MSSSTVTPNQPSAPPSSNLGAAVSQPDNINQTADPSEVPSGGGSRLLNIIKAVASVGSTAMAGLPESRRPGFVTGLGEGARSEQAAQATQQDIKFKDFDSANRAASLHNQDLELQLRSQEQNDAHQKAQDAQHDWEEEHGIQNDEIPNSAQAVTDYLKAQTTANGAATVPPGTHLSADGKSILIPRQSSDTQKGQLQQYNTFGPIYSLPSLPQGAQFVPPRLLDMLASKLQGHSLSGDPQEHQKLPGAIADLQSGRDSYVAKGSVDPAVLKQVDANLASMKTKLAYLDDHAASVKQQAEQATLTAQNSPASIKGAADKASAVEAAKQPFELQKIKAEQAIKDGDPNAAGQMLANGDIAPSQIISTRNPAFAQKAFAAAKSADPNYNPQKAEGDFKAANSPTNIGFFGSAKSLTDPGGTLEQLETAYRKLPNGQIPKLNTIADWKAAASGSGATAGFAQTALGVADDYAKVMGGGQGSDSAREEMLKSFAMASSPQQMESSIDAARSAVGSQMQSRIGSNKAMGRMYGDHLPQPTQYATASGKPRMMSTDGGKTWRPALAQ